MEVANSPISIKDLSSTSRVWIYQTNRFLTDEEFVWVKQKMNNFMPQWAAHGKQLFGAFEMFYNRFLVVAVDESKEGASGCSIDSSVHFITQLGTALKVDFFDRLQIIYKKDGDLKSCHFNDFDKLLKSGEVTSETTVFNNLVENLESFRIGWETSVKNSWHAKYL